MTRWRKPTKWKNAEGYVALYKPNHPNATAKGTILEHRYVMSKHLGRRLERGEVVHHKNRITCDNRIENLQLMNRNEHDRFHGRGEFVRCPNCDRHHWRSDWDARHNVRRYCSRSCWLEDWKKKDLFRHIPPRISREKLKALLGGRSMREVALLTGLSESVVRHSIRSYKLARTWNSKYAPFAEDAGKLKKPTAQELRKLLQSKTQTEIGTLYGVHSSTVTYWKKRLLS